MEIELVKMLLHAGPWGLLILVLWIFKDYVRFSFGRYDHDK